MKIDFKNIEEKIVPNFKGGEGRYIMKQFAMYILSGQATYVYEGQEEIVNPGEVHYNPMDKEHTLLNKGKEDLTFFAVVAEHH